jgi:hypothetical protein
MRPCGANGTNRREEGAKMMNQEEPVTGKPPLWVTLSSTAPMVELLHDDLPGLHTQHHCVPYGIY